MFVTESQVDREVPPDAPIVLHEPGAVVGVPRRVGVVIVAAAGGQAVQEGSYVLARGDGRGSAGRSFYPAIGGECHRAGRVAGGERVQAVLAQIRAGLERVVALDLHPGTEHLEGLRRQFVGAGRAQRL